MRLIQSLASRVNSRYAVAVLVLVLAATFVGANGYHYYGFNYYPTYSYAYPTLPTYSYNNAYGYNYNTSYYDGGYHYHDAGYYRNIYYPAGYYAWRNGNWVQQQGYQSPPANWKAQIIEIAKQREENKEFQDALRSLGLPAGLGNGYTNYNANLGTYGANGSTLYGYSYSTVKDLYGSTDINTLFQQAQRLAQNAQTLGGQATTEFQQAIANEGNNRSRVAEILARGQAATQALSAAQGTGSTTTNTTTVIGSTPNPGNQQPPQASGARPQITPEFAQLATQKCLKCHGGESKIEGKFDVREYPSLSLKDKSRVWIRLTSQEKEKMMPKGGTPLTPEEMMIFFKN